MRVREFHKEDYEEMAGWFREHDLPPPPPEMLSSTGFIMPGIAAGFLYVTDSSVGFLDMFISNPESGPKQRDLALDLIVKHLIARAKEMDCFILKADTQINGIKKRAQKHGFRYLGEYSSFMLEF